MNSQLYSAITALGLLTAGSLAAADWPQWRGPSRNDHSPDKGLLKSWPKDGPKRIWLNEGVGLGYAGYSVADGKLFTMGLREGQELLIALDAATGKELWATPAGTRYPNNWGDGPRMTPPPWPATASSPSAAKACSSAPPPRTARRSGPSRSSRTSAASSRTGAIRNPRSWSATS